VSNLARAGRYLIDFCDLHHGNLDLPRWSRPLRDSAGVTVL
jgi:hypothetical protein